MQMLLKRLPDVERLLSKIHVGTCKLVDFLQVLDTFDTVYAALKGLQSQLDDLKSSRLELNW
jgi:DNA mismatch repair protein MSH6